MCQLKWADITKLWRTKLFPIIGGDGDANRSPDLNILPLLALQCTDTVHEKHVKVLKTRRTQEPGVSGQRKQPFEEAYVETNLLLLPVPAAKRFRGCLSETLFKVRFFPATTQTSPPFPPCPPRRGSPMPPLPPRTYKRRLSKKFPY